MPCKMATWFTSCSTSKRRVHRRSTHHAGTVPIGHTGLGRGAGYEALAKTTSLHLDRGGTGRLVLLGCLDGGAVDALGDSGSLDSVDGVALRRLPKRMG